MNKYNFIEYKSTTSLVNGISITITSSDNNFDYASCYETLSSVTDILYKSIQKPAKNPIITTKQPSSIDLENTLSNKELLCLYVIAPHKARDNYHIHGFIYGLHQHFIATNEFIANIETKIKQLKSLSKRNKYSICLKPIHDNIDRQIRDQNSYAPLINYITNPEFDTFSHYLKHKNSNQFIFSYS